MSNVDRFQHYLTGNTQLDAEHSELIILMTELETNPSPTPEEAAAQIQHIIRNFCEHLVYEEFLMSSVDYPYAAYHKQQHAEIYTMLRTYSTSTSRYTIKNATRTLSDHFISHIDHHDLQLAQYIRDNQP